MRENRNTNHNNQRRLKHLGPSTQVKQSLSLFLSGGQFGGHHSLCSFQVALNFKNCTVKKVSVK